MKKIIGRLSLIIIFLSISPGLIVLFGQTKTPKIDFYLSGGNCSPAVAQFGNYSHTVFDTAKIKFRWYLNDFSTPFYVGYVPNSKMLLRGFYKLRVDADSMGFYMGSIYRDLEVRGTPQGFKPAARSQFCPGEEVNFQINDPVNYVEWNFGDHSIVDQNNKNSYATHVYNNPGIYIVTAKLQTECGMDSIKQSVEVVQTAKPTINAYLKGDWNACINDELSFGADGKYKSYSWSFGDGTSSTQPFPLHAFSSAKNYNVILTATNICGQSSTDTVFVNVVNNLPANANFYWWNEQNYCPNSPIHFEASTAGIYKWEFGDGGTSASRNPLNTYMEAGVYKAKLTVTNGCGNSDTKTQDITVKLDPNVMPPQAYFNMHSEFDNNNNNNNSSNNSGMDTLKVCPGTRIYFENYSGDDGTVKYSWDFADGTTSTTKNTDHVYSTAGIYMVKYRTTSNCGGFSESFKYVKVTKGIKPVSMLKAVPQDICPGEQVFFFDNQNDPEKSRNRYSLYFGDGTSKLDITKNTDTVMQTLATHVYNNAGTYNYKFKVTNVCGNSDSILGVISAVNDPAKIPFYYADNSTSVHSDGMEDWSKKKVFSDNKIVIPVKWDEWPGIDSVITAFFWWGRFDSSNPDNNGNPVGMSAIRVKNIINNGVDTIVAYVPYDPVSSDSFGVAVAWFCNHLQKSGEKAFALPMNGNIPVNSVKIVPGGTTNLSVVFAPNAFTGTCKPDISGDWYRKIEENSYYLAGIHNGSYNISQAQKPDWNGDNKYVINGSYNTKGDTIIFNSGDNCPGTGVYRFSVKGNLVTFTLIDEMCETRKLMFAGTTYTLMSDSKTYDRSGCPGDPVQFTIAGGKSFEWHFGDNSAISTAVPAYHTYADTGRYKAYVVATNACGRKDTIRTPVTIGKYNLPYAYFNSDKSWAVKGDTVRFYYSMGGDYDANKFKWDFGDGSISNLRDPRHIYQYKGNYNINLTVSNGCGSNTNTQYINIGDPFANCNLTAKFIIDKADTAKLYPNVQVRFADRSFGSFTKRTWDFGDGTLDTSAYPGHIYSKSGTYQVCLSVYNAVTLCSDRTCMQIQVGEISCKADYGFIVNNTTNTVKFNDLSLKASKWFWDFNDGSTGFEKNPVHGFKGAGVYNVCLVTSDTVSKCQSKWCNVITVGQIDSSRYCKAEYSFFVNQDNYEVSFRNTSIGKIQKGYWNFGDGLFGYEENPVHKFSTPGIYNVCASIVDSSGCQSSVCKPIQVGAVKCNSDFTYLVDPTNYKVNFTDNSLGKNLKSFWNFGDGSYSNMLNPDYKYTTPGLYKVCHLIKDSVSGCVSENCLNITIGELKCSVDYTYIIDPTSKTVKFKGISNATALKWNWDFGDGHSDTTSAPSKIYQQNGLYNVCLRVYNPVNGCIAEKCNIIAIGSASSVATVNADFGFNLDAVNLKAQFTDKSMGNPNKFYWNFGDGKFSSIRNPDHTYTKAGIYSVCQTVADTITGKISQSCKEVYLAEKTCKADFSFFVGSDNKTVTFVDLSTPKIKDNYWDFGNGKFSIRKDVVNLYDVPGTYKVCKTIVDSSGCQASVCKEIPIGSVGCKADFNYLVDANTRTVKFMDNSTGGVTSYFWEFGDGSVSNQKELAHTYVKPGVYNVCLYTRDATGGCTSQVCKEIQVGSVNCEAAFSYLVDAVNRKVSLRNESKGSATKFYWNNGLGVSDTLSSTTFIYTADGRYNICLQIYDPASNCKANICKEVVIQKDTSKLESFIADFGYFINPDSSKVVFYDKSSGSPDKFYWTFGDGGFLKGKDAVHTYTLPGVYKVCHSIFSSTSGKYAESCKDLIIGQEPCLVRAGFNLFIDSKTKTVFMSDNSKGSVSSWFWRFGDGLTSNKPNPVHTFEKPGYYLISLAVRDTVKGCTDYFADFVQVGTVDCKAYFEYSVDMSANQLSLYDKSRGDLSKYYWQLGDGSSSADKNPVHTYNGPGLYRVGLIASNAEGTCRDIYGLPIQVGKVDCSADFTYYVDSVTNVSYFNNKTLGTATNYFWTFGDGSISTEANPKHQFTAPGYYKVGLNTFNPADGCMDHYDEILLIGSEGIDCQADFFYQIDNSNLTVKLFDKSVGKQLSYLWNFGDGSTSTSNEPTHVFTHGGYYNICLTIYANNGVQSTICKKVEVATSELNNCLADFMFTVDTTSRKAIFTNKSLGSAGKFVWYFGDGSSSNTENPEHTYSATGLYNVKLAIKNETNGCQSANMKLVNVSSKQGLTSNFGYGLDTTRLKTTGDNTITFIGLPFGDPSKYVWDFGDGGKDSTTTSPTHIYAAQGTYNVCLTVSDPVTGQTSKHCSSVQVGTLGIHEAPRVPATLTAYPNPFGVNTSIVVEITNTGNYALGLYDISGRNLKEFFNTTKSAGTYWVIWDGYGIEDGVYVLKLSKGNQVVKTIRLVKQH